jgi:hypothetical protein
MFFPKFLLFPVNGHKFLVAGQQWLQYFDELFKVGFVKIDAGPLKVTPVLTCG